MDVCLQVLKKCNNSRFDSYSVRDSILIISHITFRDCRVLIFSDNLSQISCIHSYTPFIASSAINERPLVHNFQNSCSTECHWTHITQKSIEVWLYDPVMYNKCHKINLSNPFGHFLFYIILTISCLRAWTIKTSLLPTNCMRPLIKQIKVFSGILTAFFNCKYFVYTSELLGCLLEISPCGRNDPAGATKLIIESFKNPSELKVGAVVCKRESLNDLNGL